MTVLDNYKRLNNSFKKEYIFHLGAEAGFYSEFSNMISAILYCLKNQYKFVLYSENSNSWNSLRWRDYFLPFCPESTFFIHKLYNWRECKPKIKRIHYPLWITYRYLNRNTYLTYELWNEYYCENFDLEFFNIPDLDIVGDLRVASAKIVMMIYRVNYNLQNQIDIIKNKLSLPNEYISMQIRRGDKITECSLCPVEDYFGKAAQISSIRYVFILTDDYSIIDEVKNKYPNWTIFTLTEQSENGYVHAEFIKLSEIERKYKLVKLFTSIELIKDSIFFIGAYTTNVGLFLGMAMPFDRIISVQKKDWFRFSNDDISHQLV